MIESGEAHIKTAMKAEITPTTVFLRLFSCTKAIVKLTTMATQSKTEVTNMTTWTCT